MMIYKDLSNFQRFYFYELYHIHKIGQIVSKEEKEIFSTFLIQKSI